tara:strand:+ start:2463 stop:4982 length:2520 start_codon:yes stop_codon:yes gene_type:complete
MAVKVLKREYTSLFDQTNQNINWLLGNVGTWQKLTLEVAFSTEIKFSITNPLFLEDPNVMKLSDGSTWYEHGFSEGDNVTIKWIHENTQSNPVSNTQNTITAYIDRIEDEKAYLTSSYPSGGALTTFGLQYSNILPTQGADFKLKDVKVYVANKKPQGIKFTYGHIQNSNSTSNNLSSFIDGTLTEFIYEDSDLLTTTSGVVDMLPIGNQSGMSIASCKLNYLGSANYGIDQQYKIELVFMISSFFNDLTNFEDNVSPSETFDAECLSDNFEVIGYPVYNNPNIEQKNDLSDTDKLGNTGWFNENYNGLSNDFTLTSITYKNAAGTTVSKLDHANPITVTAVITYTSPMSALWSLAYGFAWIPLEEDEYKNKLTPFYKNLKMNTGGNVLGFADFFTASSITPGIYPSTKLGYSTDNARMDVKDVSFTISGSTLTYEATFMPSADFTTLMETKDLTERNYCLWLSLGNPSEVINKQNRVSMLLDYNQMETYIEPVGAYDGMEIMYFDHSQDENSTPAPCNAIDMRIEDGILARVRFTVDTAVSSTIPIPTALTYGIIIEHSTTGLVYELDSYKVDLTQFPNPTQYNFSASKGFKLKAGNNKNFIKVDHYAPLDSAPTTKGVQGLYAFKIRWEDWIKRVNVPASIKTDFYNNAALNDGINNDWYQWLTQNTDYSMYFVVYTHATLNGNSVIYKNKKPLVFVDYDANSIISSVVNYYRASDGTLLNGGTDPVYGGNLGVILNNEDVKIEIVYTRSSGSWTNINDVYAINEISVDNGSGQMEQRQLSSIHLPEPSNPLVPLSGSTLLDLQLVSPTVIKATCLVNPSLLIQANRYKISGREGCK